MGTRNARRLDQADERVEYVAFNYPSRRGG